MVSASLYFNFNMFDHFNMFDLQRAIPVISLFRHFQCNQGAADPGPKTSDGTDRRWWVHALSRSAGGLVSSGVTECTKLFFDFRRLLTGS